MMANVKSCSQKTAFFTCYFLKDVVYYSSTCRCDGIGRRSGLKIHRWRQRTGSSPVTGTKIRGRLLPPSYFGIGKRTRTHSIGTVRWTVPATSANTGGYLYFRHKRKCISSPVTGTKNSNPHRDNLRIAAGKFVFIAQFSEHNERPLGVQRVEKPRHCEPVLTLAWQSHGFSNFFSLKPKDLPSV